jgi:hypothetical protein
VGGGVVDENKMKVVVDFFFFWIRLMITSTNLYGISSYWVIGKGKIGGNMPRMKKGDRVIFEGSHDPTVVYTIEEVRKNSSFSIRSSPDFPGSWPCVTRSSLLLVTPELQQFMDFLNKKIPRKNAKKRIEILQSIFALAIF